MDGGISLNDLLEEAKVLNPFLNIQLDNTQSQGVDSIISVLKHGGMSVGVGPPGTGKTAIFNFVQKEIFDELDKDEVIVYIAPTNRLVEECAVRTLSYLLIKGFEERDLRNLIRAYGSRFKAEPFKEHVKIVFTTPYQPGALKSLYNMKRIVHLMIDEASTTPLHKPFIDLAMSMVNVIKTGHIDWLSSFSVIGDPMQAVTEEFKLQEKFKFLIVGRVLMESIPQNERDIIREDPPKIFELSKKYISSLGVKYFFLDNTYRIPRPTEYLVSIPFYNGMLKGVEDFKLRLRNIKQETPTLTSKILSRCKHINNKIKDTLDNALDSQIPIVYLRDTGPAYTYKVQQSIKTGRRPPEIEEVDTFRASLSCNIAAYLLSSTVSWIKLEVLTPYVEMKTQIQLGLRQLIGEELEQKLRHRVKVSTIHSALGSEADIIIVTMGKEYKGESGAETIYFQTPELVNVQFSRHRRFLVIIGNIERLVKDFEKVEYAKNITKVNEALNKLHQEGLILRLDVSK